MELADEPFEELIVNYFHQDWPIDGRSAEDIVRNFANENSLDTVRQTHRTISELLNRQLPEDELRRIVDALGTGFYPPGLGLTYRGWMEVLARELGNAQAVRDI